MPGSREKLVERLKDIVRQLPASIFAPATCDTTSIGPLSLGPLVEAVSSITVEELQVQLPASTAHIRFPIYFHDILKMAFTTERGFEAGLFGFRSAGDKIPLHDHYHMYGLLKAIRGRVEITSYSWLPHKEELKLMEEKDMGGLELRPALYEGRRTISSDCAATEVAVLEPSTCNLHVVEAVDDGAVFFDLLIPGYRHNECTYYKERGIPTTGEISWLMKIPVPEDLIMGRL